MKLLYKFTMLPLLFGFFLTIVSLINISNNSLPYLDPTHEMLQDQMIQLKNAEILLYVGIFTIVVSIVLLILVKILKNRKDF